MKYFSSGTWVETTSIHTSREHDAVFNEQCDACLVRHLCCDWGNIPPSDAKLNYDAVMHGGTLFSKYKHLGMNKNMTIYIITDADRLHTTILFPSEY